MGDSDEESEYVRGSECARIVVKTGQCINNMRDDIINEKKKNKALDVLVKEFSDKYKIERNKSMMLQQELEHYKTKTNRINTSLSEQSLARLFDKKDEYIATKSNEGVNELIDQMRKNYL